MGKALDTEKDRHRSTSRSYSPEPEKTEKPNESKDCDSKGETVSAPPPPKILRRSHLPILPAPTRPKTRRDELSPPKGGLSQVPLSIEKTNRLRANLGLKPLELKTTTAKGDPEKIKEDLGESCHKPATNANEAHEGSIKTRLRGKKQKTQIESNLASIKLLGEEQNGEVDSGDEAGAWVEKNRRLRDKKRNDEERQP